MFADDTQCIAGGGDLSALIDHVNEELKKISAWFRANRMAVNADKTQFVVFHNKGRRVDMDGKQVVFDNNDPQNDHDPSLVTPLIRICNNNVEKKYRTIKLLGIYLDENLTFQGNHEHLVAKLSRSIYMLNRVKNILPQKALQTLYHSLFHSHLTYCATLTNCTSRANVEGIFKLQKKAIRIVTKSPRLAHTDPIFKKHNVLTFHQVILKAQLLFMHSIFHGYAPPSFTGHWMRNDERGLQYDLRNDNDFFTPRAKYTFITRLPIISFATTWNNFGPNKHIPNRYTFQKAIEQEFFPPPEP
jgi:hypothetical protein